MSIWLAAIVACLVGAGVYCVLRPNLLRVVFGIVLLGNGVNLALFAASGARRSPPALVAADGAVAAEAVADPLPQALVLTAIVIGLGLVAFALALARLYYSVTGTLSFDEDAGHQPVEHGPRNPCAPSDDRQGAALSIGPKKDRA